MRYYSKKTYFEMVFMLYYILYSLLQYSICYTVASESASISIPTVGHWLPTVCHWFTGFLGHWFPRPPLVHAMVSQTTGIGIRTRLQQLMVSSSSYFEVGHQPLWGSSFPGRAARGPRAGRWLAIVYSSAQLPTSTTVPLPPPHPVEHFLAHQILRYLRWKTY